MNTVNGTAAKFIRAGPWPSLRMSSAATRLWQTAEWNSILRPFTSPGAWTCASAVRSRSSTPIRPAGNPSAAIPSGATDSRPVAISTQSAASARAVPSVS